MAAATEPDFSRFIVSDNALRTDLHMPTATRPMRRSKRREYFVYLKWGVLVAGLRQARTDKATRLWLGLSMIQAVQGPKEWLLPPPWLLEDLDLDGPQYAAILNRLERRGLVRVRRVRDRKRAEVRLIAPKTPTEKSVNPPADAGTLAEDDDD